MNDGMVDIEVLPEGWASASLRDLTNTTRPICYGVLKPGDRIDGGVPLIRIVDIKNNRLNLSDAHLISDELDAEFSRSRLSGGEVLLSIQGTIGRVAVVPESAAGSNISRTIAVIKTDDRTSSAFVRYWLLWASATNQFKVGGTTRNSLNISDIRALHCPLPSQEEQHQIVSILDEQLSRLDAALASVQLVREKSAQFRRSLLHAAFAGMLTGHDVVGGEPPEGWKPTSLGLLGTWTTGSTPSSKISGAFGDECPFVTPGDVDWWSKLGLVARGLSQEGIDRVRVVQPPSVLVVCIGATLGKIGWADQRIATNQQINSLSVDEGRATAKFVSLALASPSMQELLWATSSSTTIPIVNKKALMAMPFLLPPLTEQEHIVAILEEHLSRLDAALSVAETIERRSAALRRSLLHAAFTGKLTEDWRQHAHV